LQAVHFAAQALIAGVADLVVAGGVESMTIVPIGSPRRAIDPTPDGPMPGPFQTREWIERFGPDELT
jgi:acetyl-CoA C-acetyltransferase